MNAMRNHLLAGVLMIAACSPALADVYTNEQGQQINCEQQTTTTQKGGHRVLGTLAGGAVGGLVGNQFGKGSGKTALTAAGAVGGALAGRKLSEGKTQTTTTQNCQPVATPPPQ
jgi:uncharacterized protein YcfJ